MSEPAPSPKPIADRPSRIWKMAEWVMVIGLMGTIAWTTLGLGGYLAETMVVSGRLVFSLAALGGLLWVFAPGSQPLKFNRAVWWPLPFLMYSLVSVIWLAPAPWLAWREWILWFQMWLVLVLVCHFGRERAHVRVIAGTLGLLGLTGVSMAAYQRFVDGSWMMLGLTQADQYGGRSSGMFGIPNSLAAFFELMISVGLAWLVSRSTRLPGKILCAWLVVLFLIGLVLTGSRGGWLGLAAALLIWPALAAANWRRKLIGAASVGLVAVAGLAALFFFSEPARERIQPFLDGRFESSRPLIWKAGWQIWRDHPWWGSGAASYNVVFEGYRPAGFHNDPDWTHNDYLNTLSDYGVVGFALWLAAGGLFFAYGWRIVKHSFSREESSGEADWRVGGWLGLLAFAIHLAVDFHTKIPALAYAFALILALLLRADPLLMRSISMPVGRWLGAMMAGSSVLVAVLVADPLYRSEAWRYEARRSIDRYAATGTGDLRTLIPQAEHAFEQAVALDPLNAQAWADLSYAIVQSWHVEKGDLRTVGQQAEAAARKALAICGVQAEFWVRLGVALDMQARQKEGEPCFKRAVQLAPNTAAYWYYYAYHLQARAGRKGDAKQALDTCLHLDPYYRPGLALSQQLGANR